MSVVELDRVVVRLAGDSGDGMQLAGDRLTNASAILGNDLATLPDFPAEIRAPAGTLPGVSAFQLQFADHDVLTPGDTADALVAMNPAALRSQLRSLREGGVVIVNSDGFDQRALEKAGYRSNPLEDGTLSGFRVYQVPMTKLTLEAVSGLGAKPREAERAKNFFALGLVSWLYGRPLEPTVAWIQRRFAQADLIRETNLAALRAGWSYGETTEIFETTYRVKPAPLAPGTYTNITGNTALAWGLVAVSVLSGLPLFLGSYPITPASDLLHELARLKHFGVRTFQAEDEIAGIGAALGAAFGGCLGVTTTSGPGLDLKEETIGLAVALELPLVVVDVQRAGPSTGMPTKPEQSDLLAALYGRHGEAPVAVVAPQSPSDCFFAAIEAARIAIEYRTPVMLLSDAYLANGSEPWRLPDLDGLAPIEPRFASEPNGQDEEGRPVFYPYARDSETLARPWAPPGVSGLEHRIGGLEKADVSGNVSYDPENHERMVHLRAEKIARIRRVLPPAKLEGDPDAPVVVVGWGSTYGAISAAVARTRSLGHKVAHLHLRYLNPFPENLGGLLRGRKRVLVAELNLGQLCQLIRAEYLVDAKPISKVQGVPFLVAELEEALARACREVGA